MDEKKSGLRLYIGFAIYKGEYYINRQGKPIIDKHTQTFPNVDLLLEHLEKNYKKRKANLEVMDETISEIEKEQILNFINKNNLKIKVLEDLEGKISD